MAIYIVNLGSNLGQRRLFLSKAMRAIGDEFGAFEMSHVFETTPQGFESDNKFLNLSMMFKSDLEPEEVLDKLQAIEKGISQVPHRDATGGYADREIDIDIVAIDDIVINSDKLKIPHPHIFDREGFLRPLAEIAPSWLHPVEKLTAREMLDRFIAEQNK